MNGKITHKAVAESFNLEYTNPKISFNKTTENPLIFNFIALT